MSSGAWIDDGSAAMLTDLYQLTMMQAYWQEGMHAEAVFDLFARRLPRERNYLVAAGLDDVLHYLETLSFSDDDLAYLRSLGRFSDDFLGWLRALRFDGDVWAVPEGTVVYANEPIVEVVAPLPVAQLVESFVLNQVHLQTVLASKAARVLDAAGGRTIVDFGLRRMHGTDAAMKAARAFAIAGVHATSNVRAGQVYGLPVAGTMAHSYIEAHDDEIQAFRAYAHLYPDTTLLVDTYDTLEGVRRVAQLAGELGEAFRVRAIRLDSGDLGSLAKASRRILDDAGLPHLEIFASGSLDEYTIARLLADGAPIDGFGVGTRMGVSSDAPMLDSAYKIVAYAGRPRLKLSADKATLPGRKQVFRLDDDERDLVAQHNETLPGRPLLRLVMRGGQRLPAGSEPLETLRRRARAEIDALPRRLRSLATADPPWTVGVSPALEQDRAALAAALRPRSGALEPT